MISVFPKEGAADICQHTTIIFLGFPTEQHRSVMCEEKMLFISQFFWSVSLNVNSVVTKPTFSPESGTDGRLTEDNNICWWGVMRKFLSGKNTWPVSVSTAAGEMWQTRSRCLFPQAPSPTYQGLFPSTRRYAHADVREPSWRWSAIFTPPGVSRNTTSVTAGGWETAACGFLSATPGSAAEASPRRGCARLGSQTRRRISTGLTATGSPEWKQTDALLMSVSRQRCESRPRIHDRVYYSLIHQRAGKPQIWSYSNDRQINYKVIFNLFKLNQSFRESFYWKQGLLSLL